MNESEIMRILAEETEDENYGAPVHQDKVFIIMWQSSKSGGTYTELRKSVRGKNRFLQGLSFHGVDLREIQVIEQPKLWIPERKVKTKKKGGFIGG
ncbi:hypothetical protein [Paenibacillus agilis]|uniref:Uncharacterized protein n=1 Tax=Paenibacillus agilis TaxID=3020863 RepID=A0A559IEL9_9BACL|nr:hypothetical protein [Paenibacillus agilis]TVX85960.1 hypothetical protein FPZ44_23695 [Paenibacillus agilis]